MVRVTSPGRSAGGISLASADVPSISPARDPGVRVPRGEGAAIGAGLQAFSEVAGEEADLEFRQMQRDEGLARDADEVSFSGFLSETTRGMQDVGDFSDDTVTKAGDLARQKRDEVLENHAGSDFSRQRLKNKLDQGLNRFADGLAILNVNQTNVQEREAVDRRTAGVVQDVLLDANAVVGDPIEAFLNHSANVDDELDLLGLSGPRRAAHEKGMKAEVALTVLTPLIRDRQFQKAKDFLRSEEASQVLDAGLLRDAAVRVVEAERKTKAVKSDAQELMGVAQAIAPEGSTLEDVKSIARQLKGLEAEGDTLVSAGGNVLRFDKNNKFLERIEGETPEQVAQKAGMKKEAELAAQRDNITAILESVGAPALTVDDVQATLTGQPTPGTAVAGTEGEGQPAALPPPGSKTTILTDEELSTPLGPEVQASKDLQQIAILSVTADRLLRGGQQGLANSYMRWAKFIADNSVAIRRDQELDQPADAAILRDLKMPLGTTWREIAGRFLPTDVEQQQERQAAEIISLEEARESQVPSGTTRSQLNAIREDRARRGEEGSGATGVPLSAEEKARSVARGKKRGVEEVDMEEQLAFISEAYGQILDLQDELVNDPKLVGGVGGLRATGRAAFTLLGDLGLDTIVERARDIAESGLAEESEATIKKELGVDRVGGLFDNPTLSGLDILSNAIGLVLARVQTPAGRIPVEVIKRSIADVKLTGLKGAEVVNDRLNITLNRFDRRRAQVRTRFPEILDPSDELRDIPDELLNPRKRDVEEAEPEIPDDIPRFKLDLKNRKVVPVEGVE